MNSTPPPPVVDRIERTANPLVLIGLALAGAAVAAMAWFAPGGLGALAVCGAVAALAFLGALALILFAFGLLAFPSGAGRSDTAKAIADSSPDGLLVTDRHSRILYANAAYRALSGAGAALRTVERVFAGSPDVSEVGLPPVPGRQGRQAGERGPAARPAPLQRRRRGVVSHPGPAARRPRTRRVALDRVGRDPRARPARDLLPGPPARHRLSRPRAGGLLLGRAGRRDRPHERDSRRMAGLRPRPVRARPAQGRRHHRRRRRRDARHHVGPAGRGDGPSSSTSISSRARAVSCRRASCTRSPSPATARRGPRARW